MIRNLENCVCYTISKKRTYFFQLQQKAINRTVRFFTVVLGQQVEPTDELKYLRVTLGAKLNWKNIKILSPTGLRNLLWRHRSVVGKSWGLKLKVTLLLSYHNDCVIETITDGSLLWWMVLDMLTAVVKKRSKRWRSPWKPEVNVFSLTEVINYE